MPEPTRVVTALSQYTIDCISKIHGTELAKAVRLIPGWVDTSRFVPVEDPKDAQKRNWDGRRIFQFSLRCVDWCHGWGWTGCLIASHRLLGEGLKFHLVIGGSGSLQGRLEEQVRTLGLSNSVTFLGRVEDQFAAGLRGVRRVRVADGRTGVLRVDRPGGLVRWASGISDASGSNSGNNSSIRAFLASPIRGDRRHYKVASPCEAPREGTGWCILQGNFTNGSTVITGE